MFSTLNERNWILSLATVAILGFIAPSNQLFADGDEEPQPGYALTVTTAEFVDYGNTEQNYPYYYWTGKAAQKKAQEMFWARDLVAFRLTNPYDVPITKFKIEMDPIQAYGFNTDPSSVFIIPELCTPGLNMSYQMQDNGNGVTSWIEFTFGNPIEGTDSFVFQTDLKSENGFNGINDYRNLFWKHSPTDMNLDLEVTFENDKVLETTLFDYYTGFTWDGYLRDFGEEGKVTGEGVVIDGCKACGESVGIFMLEQYGRAVPEPSSVLLLLLGMFGIVPVVRRRRK